MTAEQLRFYSMNQSEQKKWADLVKKIKEDYSSLSKYPKLAIYDIRHSLDSFLQERLNGRVMGYAEGDGYFCIAETDRGKVEAVFSGLDLNAARNKLVISLARDIVYGYVAHNRKSIEKENIGKWRYRRVEDGAVEENGLTRVLSHTKEQAGWEYDAEFDYRIYWFEPLLFMVKRLVVQSEYLSTVAYYEGCMNSGAFDKKWQYDIEQESFKLLSK